MVDVPSSPLRSRLSGAWSRPWVRNTAWALFTVAAVYAMVAVDVRARAREAFRRGERYERWHVNPEEKKAHFDGAFLKEQKRLEGRKSKGELTEEEYRQDLEVLAFDRDQAVNESSIKYAYQWYKDVYELFSPPESVWVRKARLRAPAAKEKWREELRSRNIPFEEYMLDLEAGEDAGTLMVCSASRERQARRFQALLKEGGIDAVLYDAPAHGRLRQEGIKIIVPRERFWDAHAILKPLIEGE
jgi:hypothetical protein